MSEYTSNKSIFTFKQFTVLQNNLIMKVNTDAVLLAAWSNVTGALRALDIGTGTGVIALILAQKSSELYIDAIDIDENAFHIARDNFSNNALGKNISAYHCSLQQFLQLHTNMYDVIVTNPPFFSDGPVSHNVHTARFRHTLTLNRKELLEGVSELLTPKGYFDIILPYEEGIKCISLAESFGLYLHECTQVNPRRSKNVERLLMKFSKIINTSPVHNQLVIMNDFDNEYSEQFKELTKDFYLFL